jgi:hypothetical protein
MKTYSARWYRRKHKQTVKEGRARLRRMARHGWRRRALP